MDEGFRGAVAAALAGVPSPGTLEREKAEQFFKEAGQGDVEARQRLLDELVAIASSAEARTKRGVALMVMHRIDWKDLRLDKLCDACLSVALPVPSACRVLASASRWGASIPADAVARARESTLPLAMGLWLASDAPDVVEAMERVMSGPAGLQRDVMPCLARAGQDHPDVVGRMFRRNLAQGRDSLALDLELVNDALVRVERSSFSDREWGLLCCSGLTVLGHLWHCFSDETRPPDLVDAFLAHVTEEGADPMEMLPVVWSSLLPAQADMLIEHCERDFASEETFACLAAQPLASMQARERVLLKHLASEEFWVSLDSNAGYWTADWRGFSEEQLVRFLELQPRIVLLFSFAREVVSRKIVLKPACHGVLLDPNVPEEVGRTALCWYAMHDVRLFDSVFVAEPCRSTAEFDAREIMFVLAGCWSARRHQHLPHIVQQIALVTLWALTSRVGTRHIVYMILERALIPDMATDYFLYNGRVSEEEFGAMLVLLRR
jgi:hypothetical protein